MYAAFELLNIASLSILSLSMYLKTTKNQLVSPEERQHQALDQQQ